MSEGSTSQRKLAQAAQRGCRCSVPGGVQDQVGWGPGQPGWSSARSGGWQPCLWQGTQNLFILEVASNPSNSVDFMTADQQGQQHCRHWSNPDNRTKWFTQVHLKSLAEYIGLCVICPIMQTVQKEASSISGHSGTRRVISKATDPIFIEWETKRGFLSGKMRKRLTEGKDACKKINATQKRNYQFTWYHLPGNYQDI